MPDKHAQLAPSSAGRWIQCPASVRMAAKMPRQEGSVYAEEGTKAHALGELEANWAFEKINRRQYSARLKVWRERAELTDEEYGDMARHIDAYVTLLEERLWLYPRSEIMLEQRVHPGVPNCWGTADAVIISPEHVEIVDLKYGMGVPVNAYKNPQLMLYGVGALEEFGDMLGETEIVRMTVFQPRLESVSTYELPPDEIRAWRDSLLPIADEALGKNAHFAPSEDACRWCPAAGVCRARMEKATKEDFGDDPDLLSPEEIGGWLDKIPEISSWCKDVEAAALEMAYAQGTPIPGHKVVLSGGKRSITDCDKAIELLEAAGYTREQVSRVSMETLGNLEKLIGKKRLPDLLGPLLAKSEGRPSIVPEADKREAISPNTEAQKEFRS